MLIVPETARRISAAALDELSAVDRVRAVLPAKIAAGHDLDTVDVECIRTVIASADGKSASRTAIRLLGGQPMVDAVTAAPTAEQAANEPAPGPHTGAMIALMPDASQAAQLAVPDGLPADDLHITLAFLGPADEIDELTRAQTVQLVSDFVDGWRSPVRATFGHLSHFGPPDEPAAVAYELTSPGAHRFRAELVELLDVDDVYFSNRYAFRPHMTITYVERSAAESQWPAGPVEQPLTLDLTKVVVRFGADSEDIVTLGADRSYEPSGSPVTAAAAPAGLSALSGALDALNADLRLIENDVGVEVRAAVDFGWRSALDRVGRMVTRTASAAEQTELRRLEPAAVAAAADLSTVNVDALIEPAVSDVAGHVRRVVGRAQQTVLAAIGDTFAVDVDGVFPDPDDVGAILFDSMSAALLGALGRLGDVARIDVSDGDADPLVVPYALTRDVLAFAGGADRITGGGVRRDSIGRPLRSATAGADSVPLGPGPVSAVRDAIITYADGAVTADARRRPGGRISDALRNDLADAAARMTGRTAEPLEQVTVHVWRLNYNGRAIENLPRHEALAGTTVTAEADLQRLDAAQSDPNDWPGVSYSHPGDHRYCHCGWETRIELRPVQLALPVE